MALSDADILVFTQKMVSVLEAKAHGGDVVTAIRDFEESWPDHKQRWLMSLGGFLALIVNEIESVCGDKCKGDHRVSLGFGITPELAADEAALKEAREVAETSQAIIQAQLNHDFAGALELFTFLDNDLGQQVWVSLLGIAAGVYRRMETRTTAIVVSSESFCLTAHVGVKRDLTLVDETDQPSSADEGGNTDGK
jgi:hypothetical protein